MRVDERRRAASVAAGGFGAASVAQAAPAGAVCKSFSTSGQKLQWSVIGNVTCSKAKPWVVKILAQHGKPNAQAVIKPPTGFHCRATDDAKGIPAVGACYTGTVVHPKNGFQWLS